MKNVIVKNTETPWLEQLVGTLTSTGLPDGVRDVYKGRNRVVAYRPPGFDGEVNIKAFRRPIAINRMAYGWVRKGKARRSYEHALQLRRLGIGSPLPYCYVEVFDSINFLQKSYYVSEQLGEEWQEIRFLESHPDAARIVDQLAAWVAQIHTHGVLVKDLSPGNVMMRDNGDGTCSFQLVDINRMSFGCRNQGLMLGKAGRLINSEECMRRFAREYARVLGADEHDCEQTLLTEYYYHQVRLLRKQAKKAKKAQRQ